MAAISLVQLSEAVINNRFSAEYFDPRYRFTPVDSSTWVPIGRVLKKCEYGLSIQMNTDGNGFPIFRMNEIDNCFALRPEKYAAIPEALFNLYRLNENDVLFNRTNSFEFVGRTGIVKDQTGCTFASYLIRLVPNTEYVLPEFLTVFLNTPFGIGQIKRRAMRSINQANVSGSEVRRILIPLFEKSEQEIIADLVNTAFAQQRRSDSLYGEAQQLLDSLLGLEKLNYQKPVDYTAQFSELELSRRMDAEHFYPEFEFIRAKVPSGTQFIRFGNDVGFCQRGKQPIYASSGATVVNSKHVQLNHVLLEGNRMALPNPVADLNIRSGDLLINGTGVGTIGRAAPYLRDNNAVPDNHVTIIRTHKLDPVFLSVFLNSRIGQVQVRKYQRGSSGQIELYPHDIAKFQVWEAPDTIQKEIRSLIVEAHDAQEQSRILLDKAKTRVEQLIEEAITT